MSDFERRTRDLEAVAGEHTAGPIFARAYALVCNGCGKTVTAASFDELDDLTLDWDRGGELGADDLCPACSDGAP